MTTFALETEGSRYSYLKFVESVLRFSVNWYRICGNFFNIYRLI